MRDWRRTLRTVYRCGNRGWAFSEDIPARSGSPVFRVPRDFCETAGVLALTVDRTVPMMTLSFFLVADYSLRECFGRASEQQTERQGRSDHGSWSHYDKGRPGATQGRKATGPSPVSR